MYKSAKDRKTEYVDMLASTTGIDLAMLKWEINLDEIFRSIGFNILFRFYLDLFLQLDFHFDFSEFDFWDFDLREIFPVEFEEAIEKVEKARYGISEYGKSIYDPEQVTSQNYERMLWDQRYKLVHPDGHGARNIGPACRKIFDIYADFLRNKGVREEYIRGVEAVLPLVEGKIFTTSYFDFAIFDVSPFADEKKCTVRSTEDFETEIDLETERPYESYFDHSRFDYSRFSGLPVEQAKKLADAIDEFQKRAGMVEQYGLKVLRPRVFGLQRTDRLHRVGGGEQVNLQHLINRVKIILDSQGVAGMMRNAYLSFAQELAYLGRGAHRKWKRWKEMLSPDDLIEKYKSMGCDEGILRTIRGVVG